MSQTEPQSNELFSAPNDVERTNPPDPATSPTRAQYARVEVRPGLELHVSEEFQLPPSAQERDSLLEEILAELKAAGKRGDARRRRR